jgi:hypothetical protein
MPVPVGRGSHHFFRIAENGNSVKTTKSNMLFASWYEMISGVCAVRVPDPAFSQDYKLMFFIRRKTQILVKKAFFKTFFSLNCNS